MNLRHAQRAGVSGLRTVHRAAAAKCSPCFPIMSITSSIPPCALNSRPIWTAASPASAILLLEETVRRLKRHRARPIDPKAAAQIRKKLLQAIETVSES